MNDILSIINSAYHTLPPETRAAKKLYKLGYREKDMAGLDMDDSRRIPVVNELRRIEMEKKELASKVPGRKGAAKKFTEEQQEDIRDMYLNSPPEVSITYLARLHKCSPTTISRIIERKY